MILNQESGVLCWHRLRIAGRHYICRHCSVLVEECPCVTWRMVQDDCPCCMGSGWVAVVRGQVEKFAGYLTEGQLGLEACPHEYIRKMVEIFAEVRRVLRRDGSLWLNMGDTYAAGGKGGGGSFMESRGDRSWSRQSQLKGWRSAPPGWKNKDLMGMPWRVAFALQADGWYLRSDIIWHKPNCSPSGVSDRPTSAHEYMFLLSKSDTYFYDKFAVTEPTTGNAHPRGGGINPKAKQHGANSRFNIDRVPRPRVMANPSWSKSRPAVMDRRNRRSVWTIASQPFKGAHFATFPEKLVEPCILAGTSQHGCCVLCGAPWRRELERPDIIRSRENTEGKYATGPYQKRFKHKPVVAELSTGWRPGCECTLSQEVAPAIVMDPFCGSGTVGVVSVRHGRTFTGIDLNPEYLTMARARITAVQESSAA